MNTRDDSISVYSITGQMMFYLGCPVLWVSKPQSEISLSTVEAEYMALSIAIRDMIPFTDQVTELTTVFNQEKLDVKLHCTLFEDNDRALELAIIPWYCPRIKRIAIKYHHFRERVKKGIIDRAHRYDRADCRSVYNGSASWHF